MQVFQELYSLGKFEKSLNTTFIVLISKKIRVVDVKENGDRQGFRPERLLIGFISSLLGGA